MSVFILRVSTGRPTVRIIIPDVIGHGSTHRSYYMNKNKNKEHFYPKISAVGSWACGSLC